MTKYKVIDITRDDKCVGKFNTKEDAQAWINKEASECGGRGEDGKLCDGCLIEHYIEEYETKDVFSIVAFCQEIYRESINDFKTKNWKMIITSVPVLVIIAATVITMGINFGNFTKIESLRIPKDYKDGGIWYYNYDGGRFILMYKK